jgi:glutaredoxin 3
MAKLELFGTSSCTYTAEMREWLEWNGREFDEYDVERDHAALARMRAATDGQSSVPVLLEDGKAVQIGWRGRGCFVGRSHA